MTFRPLRMVRPKKDLIEFFKGIYDVAMTFRPLRMVRREH